MRIDSKASFHNTLKKKEKKRGGGGEREKKKREEGRIKKGEIILSGLPGKVLS